MTTPPNTAPGTAWKRWVHFWFTPSDPTTMGLLRIATGLLVLYTHLAHSFDLYSFFGVNGWYGLDAVNRERREFPWVVQPFADGWKWWDESARFPDEPHRRQALLAFTRSLPTDRATLDKKLAILAVEGLDDDGYPHAVGGEAVKYARDRLGDDPLLRSNALKALAKEIPRDPREPFPPQFDQLEDPTRAGETNWRLKKLAHDLEEFYSLLPRAVQLPTDSVKERQKKLDAAADARNYIVSYIDESDDVRRHNFLKFARDLCCPPAEREKKLDYFAHWNIERRYIVSAGNPVFSLWFHITSPTQMAVAHGIVLFIMLLFTLGLFTRVTAVLTWLAAVSYIHRNQQVLFGQDTMMNILLLYLMIANCGAALSLDRLIARFRAARASLKRTGTIDPATARYLSAPPPSVASGFAQRLLQVHFCFIYMAAGLSKLKGPAWWNTSAFWDTMANPEFTMVHYQWYQELLRWMAGERAVYAAVAAFGVGFTLVVEIGLPFLVWTKVRPFIMIGGMLMHFGIGLFMGLIMFSLYMMTMLACFLPGGVIRRQLFGLPPAERTRLVVDPANDTDVRKAAWAVAKDLSGRIEVARK